MNQKFLKVICGLTMLGSMLTGSACADLLTLDYSGFFGRNTTLGGTAFGSATAFSLAATCNTDSIISQATGHAEYAVTSFSIVINGTTYTGSPTAGLNISLGDPRWDSNYFISIDDAAHNEVFFSAFSGATPDFLADTPTTAELTGYKGSDWNNNYNIALDGVVGGLVFKDLAAAPMTASITTTSVPEPSTFALLGLSALGLAAYRGKTARK